MIVWSACFDAGSVVSDLTLLLCTVQLVKDNLQTDGKDTTKLVFGVFTLHFCIFLSANPP